MNKLKNKNKDNYKKKVRHNEIERRRRHKIEIKYLYMKNFLKTYGKKLSYPTKHDVLEGIIEYIEHSLIKINELRRENNEYKNKINEIYIQYLDLYMYNILIKNN